MSAVAAAAAKQLTSYDKMTADPKRVIAVALIIISILAVVLTISYKEYYWAMVPLGTFCLATCFLICSLRNDPNFGIKLRAVPSLILLAVCVIGTVTALVYHQPYLTIPFLVGLLAAGYNLSLSCDYENLKSFSAEVDRFANENATLKVTSGNLAAQVNALKYEQAQREAQITRLTAQVTNLENTNLRLETLARKIKEDRAQEIAKLKGLHAAIQQGGQHVLGQFGGSMAVFAELLEAFDKENLELSNIAKNINQNVGVGVANLKNLASDLREVAKGVSKYLNDNEAAAKNLQMVLALQSQQTVITKKLAKAETRLQLLTPLVDQMQGMLNQQERALNLLKQQLEIAGTQTKDLEGTKRELDGIKNDLLRGLALIRTNARAFTHESS